MEQSQRQKDLREPRKASENPTKKEIQDFVQDFIPIKEIKNGIIKTINNRYIKILEIEPINFTLRSTEEQNNILYNFASWFKVANTRLQFKSITKKADSERYIALLRKDFEAETNPRTKELLKSYMNLVRTIGGQEAVTHRFFLILEYEPFPGMAISDDYQEIFQTIENAVNLVKSYFSRCGNSIVETENEDFHIGSILYMFFNRRSSIEEPFISRIKRVNRDTLIAKDRIPGIDPLPPVPAVNYIAPRGIDLSHSKYLIMDGLYYTFLYIKSDGYPSKVHGGWLSSLVNAGEGIDIDVFFEKQDKSKVLDKLQRKIRLNKIKMKDIADTSGDFEELRDSIGSGYFIKEAINTNNEDLFFMSTIITISAPTLRDLEWKKHRIKEILKSQDMITAETNFYQENCLRSTMPFLDLDKALYRKSRRNVITSSAASTYMFTAFEMCDDNGILLGVNANNSSLCIVDIFNSRVYKNANITILGTSGSGKTFTEQLMALRMRMRGIQVFILAPLKGHEFRRACANIGGSYIKLSASSSQCINIMQIRPTDTSIDELIEGEGNIREDSFLGKKVQQLNTFFSLVIPDITDEEEQLLDEAIFDVYALRGITEDNDSLYDDEGNIKQMPVLGDLYNLLANSTLTRRIAIILSKFVSGAAQTFNQQTNVDLNNKYIVMDISELDGKLLPIGMFIALDYCWDKIKEDRTKKKAIFIDETWCLIGASSNRFAAEFVLEIFKIIRGYGGAAIAATQDLGDFFALEDGKYGKGIINNSKTKIILNLESDEADTVRDCIKLSKAEYRNIINFERGQALISSNNNKLPVLIKASNVEKDLITTDRSELAAQAEKKKQELRKQEKEARNKIIEERLRKKEENKNDSNS